MSSACSIYSQLPGCKADILESEFAQHGNAGSKFMELISEHYVCLIALALAVRVCGVISVTNR